jgi:hypothetical protein
MGWSSEVGVQVEFAPGGFEETARPGGGNTPRRSVDLRFGSTAWSVDLTRVGRNVRRLRLQQLVLINRGEDGQVGSELVMPATPSQVDNGA